MLFNDWESLAWTALVGVPAYVLLLLIIRLSGKRTLSKMNAFDLVVTVALGSALATILLSPDVPLAQGVLALALLVGLQAMITWLSVRSPAISRLVKSEPVLLFYGGEFLHGAMRRERVTESELLQAMRQHGVGSDAEVEAMVLESDGSLSVVRKSPGPAIQGSQSALSNVAGAREMES